MKAPFSPYLLRIKPGLKQLVTLLRRDYDYVSVLATDSVGLTVSISRRARSTPISDRAAIRSSFAS